MKKFLPTLLSLCALQGSLSGQTIAEKLASFEQPSSDLGSTSQAMLTQVNSELKAKKLHLYSLYKEVEALEKAHAPHEAYLPLTSTIQQVQEEIAQIELGWQDFSANLYGESYALWNHPEATLDQVIQSYGSQTHVYIIPQEMGDVKISINSNLPIPQEAWEEMLSIVLGKSGIGIRQITPFLRALYYLAEGTYQTPYITDDRTLLATLPETSLAAFMLDTKSLDVPTSMNFFQRFANPSTISTACLGSRIVVVGQVYELKHLFRLYDFIQMKQGGQEYRIIPVTKIGAKEMADILNSLYYGYGGQKKGVSLPSSLAKRAPLATPTSQTGTTPATAFSSMPTGEGTGALQIVALDYPGSSLFISGPAYDVALAEHLIEEVQSQIDDPREKTIYWYTCKHSDPEEIAAILDQIYQQLILTSNLSAAAAQNLSSSSSSSAQQNVIFPRPIALEQEAGLPANPIVQPKPIGPKTRSATTTPTTTSENFIVDPKTGSVIMVVEQQALPKLKEMLKKLDVPKKMVQMDVLIFETTVTDETTFGLNLLQLGSRATNTRSTGSSWNDAAITGSSGILEFFVSRPKTSGFTAIDFQYLFMLSQEDIHINASPTITTVNQTPAQISIVDEISISTGVYEVDVTNATRLKDSFVREQYGITVQITPTINWAEDTDNGELSRFVTLDTQVNFDIIGPRAAAGGLRPDVARRQIVNQVRVEHGETVILGGLRRKSGADSQSSIPFLGEIPGLGKLFSTTTTSEKVTELYIFITPKIIADPAEELARLRDEELKKRPGDTPEFLDILLQAREQEQRSVFSRGLNLIFQEPGVLKL